MKLAFVAFLITVAYVSTHFCLGLKSFKPAQTAVTGSLPELPPDWRLEYNATTKHYRWCDNDNYCNAISYKTQKEAIEMAWAFLSYRQSDEWKNLRATNKKENWRKVD